MAKVKVTIATEDGEVLDQFVVEEDVKELGVNVVAHKVRDAIEQIPSFSVEEE